MPAPVHRGRAAALSLALLLPAAPDAAEGWFTTAAGKRIETPAIELLDCAGMIRVLTAIDATGYRTGKAKPVHPADMALRDYEDILAKTFFSRCARGQTPTPRAAADAADQPARSPFAEGYE